MTGDLSVARRYASALFAVASKRNEVAEVAQSLGDVVDATSASPELMTVLHHPRVTEAKKKKILHEIFGGQVHADVEKFLILVVDKGRAVLLPEMVREFGRLVDEHNNETDAVATSAVALSAEQTAQLEKALSARFGKTIRLTTRVDEKILGGLVVRVGDKLIDSSVAARLQRLNEQLKRVKVA